MTTVSSVEERSVLQDTVRRSLERHPGPRPFMADEDRPASLDRGLWATLAEQVGVTSLVVPESCGGAGASYVELAAVAEILGRYLAPVPALATLGMATGVLIADAGPAAAPLLARIAEGATVATVAWADVAGAVTGAEAASVQADLYAGTVSGTVACVVSGAEADLLLVPATTRHGVALMAVEGAAPGMVRRAMKTLDLTQGMAEVAFDGAPATLIREPESSADVLSVGSDLALTVLAAEQVGVAQRCLDDAVAWCKQRVQFDRPIGSFQAVKHTLVDLLLEVELARSALDEAVAAADRHVAERLPATARELRAAASMATAMCSDAAVNVSRQSLHLFGGIGFTWEHDAHLYYRRALAGAALLGDSAQHRVRLAAAVGL